jgi:hypothetical protein
MATRAVEIARGDAPAGAYLRVAEALDKQSEALDKQLEAGWPVLEQTSKV